MCRFDHRHFFGLTACVLKIDRRWFWTKTIIPFGTYKRTTVDQHHHPDQRWNKTPNPHCQISASILQFPAASIQATTTKRAHQPDLLRSCKRFTNTAAVGHNEKTKPKAAVCNEIQPLPAIEKIIANRSAHNPIHIQKSRRPIRPLKEKHHF